MATQTVSLNPNANGSFSGTWGGTGTPAYSYTEIDEGTTSPVTESFVSCGTSSSYRYYGLDACPGDWVTALTCTLKFYAQDSGKGTPQKWATAQIFKSDGTTALTATGDISGTTGSYSLLSVPLTVTGDTDKTSWDGALIKFISGSTGSGSAYIAAFQLDMEYSDVALSSGVPKQFNHYAKLRA